MNVPKAIEKAIGSILRGSELADGVAIRCWQSLAHDPGWDKDKDRTTPMIDVRFAPETVDANQATMESQGEITVATSSTDDRDHAQISALYESVHDTLRAIFRDLYDGDGTTEYAAFVAAVEESLGEDSINIGGVTFRSQLPPDTADGLNTIGIGFSVHFSYA